MRQPQRLDEPVQHAGEVGQTVARDRLGGAPEAGKIEGVHGGAIGERGHVVAPRLRKTAEPVDEDDRGPATFDQIVDGESVDFPAP